MWNTSEVSFASAPILSRSATASSPKTRPTGVLDYATSEIAIGSKLGIDATKKISGEGFKRPWPPLIKMDAAVKAKVERLLDVQIHDKLLTNS